jgi:CheY-like chemotaxis protein
MPALRFRGRVLLVEDEPLNRMLVGEMLTTLGLDAELAANGQEALEQLAQHTFDLVLMDCQMPVKDGLTATREWRADEARRNAKRTPIAAITANALQGDRERCLESGMDDYLAKPFRIDRLALLLSRFLRIEGN